MSELQKAVERVTGCYSVDVEFPRVADELGRGPGREYRYLGKVREDKDGVYRYAAIVTLLENRRWSEYTAPCQAPLVRIYRWPTSGDKPIATLCFGSSYWFQLVMTLRDALEQTFAILDGDPLQVGDTWDEIINQGERNVEVVDVKRTRFRIEYEMPNAGMMGRWETGLRVGNDLFRAIVPCVHSV